ncbi:MULTISPECIES: hypothetical protein [Streptomyces]|uniref:Uncharacterized protein n=1 Tax=Streptomyces flavovirens TaxID=52258 RepID=A0ABV8N353_9ACTN|nr:hypothetical protein [Streptomyces sp. MBT51]MBK3594970.1 hypothetical protein [Streptomyces sp. MBT51]
MPTTQTAGFETAAGALAKGLVRAANGAGQPPHPGFQLHRCTDEIHGAVHRLGAVRMLGADVLALQMLARLTPSATDVALVREAVQAFPAPPPAECADTERTVWQWRDWALRNTLAGLGVETTDWEGFALPAGTAPDAPVPGMGGPWPTRAAALVRLSSLALPSLAGPVAARTAHHSLDVRRGLVRALLRRDLLSAARLARWLALTDAQADRAPALPDTADPVRAAAEVPVGSAVEHIALLAADEPRVQLEIEVTRRLLDHGRSVGEESAWTH